MGTRTQNECAPGEVIPETPFAYLSPEEWIEKNTSPLLIEEQEHLFNQPAGTFIYEQALSDTEDYWRTGKRDYTLNDILAGHIPFPELGILALADNETLQSHLYHMAGLAQSIVYQEQNLRERADESWGLQPLGFTRYQNRNYRTGHVEGWIHAKAQPVDKFGTPVLAEEWNAHHTEVTFRIVGTDNPRHTAIWTSQPVTANNVTPALHKAGQLLFNSEALAVLIALNLGAIAF
jgi:hypothetical protein